MREAKRMIERLGECDSLLTAILPGFRFTRQHLSEIHDQAGADTWIVTAEIRTQMPVLVDLIGVGADPAELACRRDLAAEERG
jgi:hypothetical protein